MAKYYGMIGYGHTRRTAQDVFEEVITEHEYCGDLVRNTRRTENDQNVNNGITLGNEISIVSDPYAEANFHHMRYITFMGEYWKVNSVEVKYPRLIISIGGVWNGPTGRTGSDTAPDSEQS